MSAAIGFARALGGFSQGMQQEDERRRILEERAQMRAAAELKDRLDRERQGRLDAQATEQTALNNRMRLAEQARQMTAAGFQPYQAGMMDGQTKATADALPTAAPVGMGGGLFGAAGEGVRARGMQQAPELAAAQGGFLKTGMSEQEREREQAQQEKAQAQQAQEAQRAQVLASLPKSIQQKAAGLPLNTLVALQSSVLDRDLTPRESSPVNMQVIQTESGPMAFNPRTGEARPITAGGQPVRGGGGKTEKPTAVQLQARGFYDRMAQSSKIMEAFEKGGALPTEDGTVRKVEKIDPVRSLMARGGSMVPFVGRTIENNLTDKNRQQYWNAASNWVRANLRKESGAVIGIDEMEQEIATYFPMPGDSPETRDQKRQLRATTEAAMARMANTPQAEPLPADTEEPTTVPARKPGESIADYRRRTGGR